MLRQSADPLLLYSNWTRAPYMVYCTMEYYQWESSCVGGPDENGIEPADVENEVQDGDVIPVAGGIRVIHVPGHSAGQLAFLWEKNGGVLFAAEAAFNTFGIVPSNVGEDFEEAIRSLKKIATLDFDTACFCHGNAIVHGASSKFKQKWGTM